MLAYDPGYSGDLGKKITKSRPAKAIGQGFKASL